MKKTPKNIKCIIAKTLRTPRFEMQVIKDKRRREMEHIQRKEILAIDDK